MRAFEKLFCPDLKNKQEIFGIRGIDRNKGALLIIRPDQYIASIMPLEDYRGLTTFFERFMR